MWKTVKLGDVCDLSTGGTPSRTKPEYFDNGDVKWLVSGDINQREIFDCDGRITQEGLKNSNAKYLPLNSVLIALNGQGKTRGTVALLRIKATCNQSLVAISPKVGCDLDTKYIFYVLDGMYDKIRKLTGDSGNDRRGLNMPLIRNIPFSLPPLAEQKRIVAKLDAAFAEIDGAIEAVEKKSEDAKAIINSGLAEIFQNEADNWEVKKLSEVCMVERGSSPRPIKQYFTNDDGVNWIKIGDTEQDGKYVTSTKQKITAIGAKKSRHVKVGDFILTNSMSYGRPYIMGIEGYIHDGWFVLRLDKDIDTEYFYYLLISPYVQHQFHKLAAGAVVKNISGDLVKKTILPIPPLERQKEIREKIVEIEAQTQQLKETYKLKLENLIALKSAILAQELQSEAA